MPEETAITDVLQVFAEDLLVSFNTANQAAMEGRNERIMEYSTGDFSAQMTAVREDHRQRMAYFKTALDQLIAIVGIVEDPEELKKLGAYVLSWKAPTK